MGTTFNDQTAVVTGAAGGLGRAICAALSERGARVAGLDVAPVTDAALAVSCDVGDASAVAGAMDTVVRELGPPALLVTAAGVLSERRIVELEPAEWQRVVDASLTGTFLTARAVAAAMAERGGAIVTISTGWATKGYAGGAHYAAAKAGVEALTKSLALELAPRARANCVALGPIRSPMTAQVDPAVLEQRAAAIPLGRMGDAGDVVGPVLFLLGDASRYVTGQVLHVNGGLLMP